VRPEMIEIAASKAKLPKGLAEAVTAKIINRIFVGDVTQYRLAHDRLGEFLVVSPRRADAASGTFDIGDEVLAGWRADAAQVLADT